ncbi:TPA: hypothetical protein L4T60_004600 [Pseudomonas aeruginosa]|uniref:hypothetical protein n=2 Tax=Pseudomonas aeruginosa TaxID=287 RepID=UPI0009A1F2DC|nr:hypothetical protein [Pseudomonas aeruginosa]MDI2164487.1 hypothetical protein [Pseudomonas aeruginosa]OPF27163.1 hypothetical protein C533_28784 [Pseudomonas aeruginosa P47]OPF27750.1 hypothetical protein C532_28677 [Pseudomonas aeruginosa P37]OPF43687.1 hypothetical protein C534_28832 [Pseudomonas aeruginosa P49]HBN8336457.1 hypothetical protein [Pseudomonas aeruginosa]
MTLSFSIPVLDAEWGCSYQEVANSMGVPDIRICFVKVDDIKTFAESLTGDVLDTSWMANLDKGVRRQYDYTVKETAAALVGIFKDAMGGGKVGAEFGEVMVSIGSARALEQVFSHSKVPIAELWKPQVKQNEGFDFHTVCTGDFINFGEAKFSASINPHGLAISQAADFISVEKHLRDRGHLVNLVGASSIENLDNDKFGVVAAFSINSDNPLKIFRNALESALDFLKGNKVSGFYLVGVGSK